MAERVSVPPIREADIREHSTHATLNRGIPVTHNLDLTHAVAELPPTSNFVEMLQTPVGARLLTL
jgi:hypothetical protein